MVMDRRGDCVGGVVRGGGGRVGGKKGMWRGRGGGE